MRILLVDDDRANLDLFTDILEGAGHSLAVEHNGSDGRERALRELFDLIILDIQLPAIPGDVVCQQLRQSGVRTPIIALSADALPHQVETGLAAGFDRYLTKPISPAELRAAVLEFARPPESP